MTRKLHQLSARTVDTTNTPGRYADGGGLYLAVADEGRKRWTFIYTRDGKKTELGLGPAGKHGVGLADARSKAAELRVQLNSGQDPKEERDRRLSERKAPARQVPTFGDFAITLVADIEGGFRNAKHRQQWRNTLTTYCASIAMTPIDKVDTESVLNCLRPIWLLKAETASRLRGRIERVLDAAKAKGLRSGENPARWRGHLDALLPRRQKLQRGHHLAMAFDRVPDFADRLRARQTTGALALEFCILTAARSGEVLGATWSEIDLEKMVWTVPGRRMKAGRDHRVPLVGRALDILGEMALAVSGDTGTGAPKAEAFVFPGRKPKRPLSVMAMEMVLRQMKVTDATVHGFRSSFRDWCGERTNFHREIAEAALAHVVGNAVEQAELLPVSWTAG